MSTNNSTTTGLNLLTPVKGKKSIIGRKFRIATDRAYKADIRPELEIISEINYAASNDTFSTVQVRNNTTQQIITLPIRHNYRYETVGK